MTRRINIIPLITCFWPFLFFSQTGFPTKDSVYVFWQEENRTIFKDWKQPLIPTPQAVIAVVGVWTVLDLPQDTNALTLKQIKYYIAPVRDRNSFNAYNNDTTSLIISNIYFDICEITSRKARQKLNALSDSLMSRSALSLVFKKIIREMHEDRLRMDRKFYRDIFREKKNDALNNWLMVIDKDLESSSQWTTKPEDCYRFLCGHPLESGYTEDLNSNAVVTGDKYEQVLSPDTWHAGFYQITRQRPKK